jgi:hypothetical protein
MTYDNAVKHLGYDPGSLSEEAKMALIADSQKRLAGLKILPESSLTPTQLSSLSLARAIAEIPVYPAALPQASDRVRTAGVYSRSTKDIYIAPDQLDQGKEAVSTAIHELAHHTSGAEDGEPAHQEEMRRIAGVVVERVTSGAYDDYLKESAFQY